VAEVLPGPGPVPPRRDACRLVRRALAVLSVVGSVVLAAWALGGGPDPLGAGVACLLAIGTVRVLPGGSRAGAWLFVLWLALALVLAGRARLGETPAGPERWRVAALGAATYLVLAFVAFRATAGGCGRRERTSRTGGGAVAPLPWRDER